MSDKDNELKKLVKRFHEGVINRRNFLKLAAAMGVSTATCNELLAQPKHHGKEHGKPKPKPKPFQNEPSTEALIQRARELGIDLIWDRGSPCRFSKKGMAGAAGMCCFRCQMGPCTLGKATGMAYGACGASKDVIAARDLVRRIAGGTSAHVEHARAVAKTLKGVADGSIKGYEIADYTKLEMIFEGLSCNPEEDKALAVAQKSLGDINKDEGEPDWLHYKASPERIMKWQEKGLIPTGAGAEVMAAEHRTTMGVDADMAHLASGGLRLGLVDGYCGMHIATSLQDVLFGTPAISETTANLSVIDKDAINIVINGHEPLLAEKILQAAFDYNASHPLTPVAVSGMCCSGNEILMRKGVPLAGSMVQQELAIVTGAVEAMVVDVQCITPSIQRVAENFHTRVITTHPHARITGATHMEFSPENADAIAKEIVLAAVENYRYRDSAKVFTPNHAPQKIMAGFSTEQIIQALQALDPINPLNPLINCIKENKIRGIVAIVGCVTPSRILGEAHVTLTQRLIAENILVVGTGCWGHVAAQYGFLTPDKAYPGVGTSLAGVLNTIASKNGLEALPPCWHMGSCVDNSRIDEVVTALSTAMNLSIHQLPVAASAPEFVNEKAVSIAAYALNLGLLTHLGDQPYINGSQALVTHLTNDVEGVVDGRLYVEYDPDRAADTLIHTINRKRLDLGLGI